jgi:hypothetical protein
MIVWFGATSNQGAIASVEFVLARVNNLINVIIKEDTDREEDFLETRNRPDGYDTVVYLSLQGRVREQERGRGGKEYLFEFVWEGGPRELIKLGVCVPNRMGRSIWRGGSEVNDMRDEGQSWFIWLLYLGLTERKTDGLAELVKHLRELASGKETIIAGRGWIPLAQRQYPRGRPCRRSWNQCQSDR